MANFAEMIKRSDESALELNLGGETNKRPDFNEVMEKVMGSDEFAVDDDDEDSDDDEASMTFRELYRLVLSESRPRKPLPISLNITNEDLDDDGVKTINQLVSEYIRDRRDGVEPLCNALYLLVLATLWNAHPADFEALWKRIVQCFDSQKSIPVYNNLRISMLRNSRMATISESGTHFVYNKNDTAIDNGQSLVFIEEVYIATLSDGTFQLRCYPKILLKIHGNMKVVGIDFYSERVMDIRCIK